eukprot:12920706-Prorocentrum_lima.AAC.1
MSYNCSALGLEAATLQVIRDFWIFPCHRLTIRHTSHDVRRIFSSPWHFDAFVDALITSIVTGPNSICQVI